MHVDEAYEKIGGVFLQNNMKASIHSSLNPMSTTPTSPDAQMRRCAEKGYPARTHRCVGKRWVQEKERTNERGDEWNSVYVRWLGFFKREECEL